MTGATQQLLATLADADRRALYARLVLEGPLPTDALTARDRRRLDALARAGLADVHDSQAFAVDGFSPLLRSTPAAKGLDRFVRSGRIAVWPSKPADRDAVMRWAAESVLDPGERVDESTFTERLGSVTDDPVALRRDLVDGGIVSRAPDGSTYWR